MKVINSGDTYKIFNNHVRTYDTLPSGTYELRFNKMEGFYLEGCSDFSICEDKIYGVVDSKVSKTIKKFKKFDKNLGVILSGAKGIGKSLFGKLLSAKMIEEGYPVIIVRDCYNGLATYLDSIEQEVMIFFDEFDKMFKRNDDNGYDPQDALLSLFDGLSISKRKLFLITCNEISRLNDFIINRPGRFHYHFRFEHPSDIEIREYLMDKIDKKFHGEIEAVVNFSRRVELNFDCLRAIASEIQDGETFKDLIKDINILNVDNNCCYKITLHFDNGETLVERNRYVEIGSGTAEDDYCYLYNADRSYNIRVYFNADDAIFSGEEGCYIIPSKNFKIDYRTNNDNDNEVKRMKTLIPEYLSFRRIKNNLHYTV